MDSTNKRPPISEEQIKAKRKELVVFIKSFKNYIESIESINQQVKSDLLFCVDEILKRAILTEEVVRQATTVSRIKISESADIKFKRLLNGALYEIFSSLDMKIDFLAQSQFIDQSHKPLCDDKNCDCEKTITIWCENFI